MKKLNKIVVTLFILFLIPCNTYAVNKTETIFSNLNYDGSVKMTTINTRLTNIQSGDVIDYTNLSDIKNVNGEEKFSKESAKIIWKSTGKDIYYQGTINSQLPISINVKYYLNGEEVNPSDIKNKSGSVKIVFNLINNDYIYSEGLYVPYVVDVTTTLNNKFNSNYYVSNGKVVSLGEKSVITALSSPGLYENTKISEFNNLDQVILNYDTTKYEKSEFYFVITPKLLSNVDLDKINQVSSKLSQVDSLYDGSKKIEDGSKELYNGTSELSNGLTQLNEGIKSALDGSSKLMNGLKTVNDNSASIGSLTVLVDKLYSTYNSNNDLLQGIESGTTEEQLKNGISNATAAKSELENQLSQVNAGISQLEQGEALGMLTDEQVIQLNTLRSQKLQLESGISQYEQGIIEAQNNLAMLPTAKYKILGANEVISQVLCGILGVPDMSYVNDQTIALFKENISKLVGGINSLYNGSTELNNGLEQLYEGSNKLVAGSKQIEEGNKTLSEGIIKLNNEGISKLVSIANQVKDYSNRFSNITKLSKNYTGFGSNNADNTIFIYKLS